MPLNTSPEAIDRLRSMDPMARRSLLERFTPEERQELLGALKGQAQAPLAPATGMFEGLVPSMDENLGGMATRLPGAALGVGKDISIGAAKSLGDTALKTSDLLQRNMGVGVVKDIMNAAARKFAPEAVDEAGQREAEARARIESVLTSTEGVQSGAKTAADISTMVAGSAVGGPGGVVKTAAQAAWPTLIKSGGDPKETGIAGLLGGGFGLAAKAASPFAKAFRPVKAAERLGIELPASARTTSAPAQEFEALAAKGFGGQKIIDRAQKAMDDLDTVAATLQGGTRADTGQAVNASLRNARTALEASKNQAYDALGDLSAYSGSPSEYYDAMQTALSRLERAKGPRSPLVGKLKRYMREIEIRDPETGAVLGLKDMDAEALKQTRTAWNESMESSFAQGGRAGGDLAHKRSIAKALQGDIKSSLPSDMQMKWDAATNANIALEEKIDSVWAREIGRLAKQSGGRWEKIAERVSGADASTLRHMKTVLDQPTMDAVKATRITDLLGQARSPRTGLSGSKLKDLIESNADELAELMPADELARLKDLGETANALSGSQGIIKGSQTAYLGRMLGYGAATFTNPLAALRIVIGESAFNRFVATKAGQQWLTQGYPRLARTLRGTGTLGAAGVTAGLERQKEEDRLKKLFARQKSESLGAP